MFTILPLPPSFSWLRNLLSFSGCDRVPHRVHAGEKSFKYKDDGVTYANVDPYLVFGCEGGCDPSYLRCLASDFNRYTEKIQFSGQTTESKCYKI